MSTRPTALWTTWFVRVTAVGAVTSSAPLLVLAGIAEGAVLGAAQRHVLRRAIPGLDTARRIGLTALAAAFAWAIALFVVHYSERLGTLPLASAHSAVC